MLFVHYLNGAFVLALVGVACVSIWHDSDYPRAIRAHDRRLLLYLIRKDLLLWGGVIIGGLLAGYYAAQTGIELPKRPWF